MSHTRARDDRFRRRTARPSAPRPAKQQAVTLVSVNLHAGYDAHGSPYDLWAACQRLRADILLAQETWRVPGRHDPLADWARERGARILRADVRTGCDLHAMGISPDPCIGDWGLAVVTILPVLHYETTCLGQAPGDRNVRTAQLVTVELPSGRALRVVNTHLTHRLTSPVQLMRLVLRLAADPAPTVIAGDLNMPAPVTGLAAGYSPAVTGRTFPAHRPLVQLDHILTGRGVEGREGAVLPAMGSDHLPVRARLSMPA
jgi:endonuclease/exonuclease/phosphatase family metal-dependent hydrolase